MLERISFQLANNRGRYRRSTTTREQHSAYECDRKHSKRRRLGDILQLFQVGVRPETQATG
jgi:hypothetical protein